MIVWIAHVKVGHCQTLIAKTPMTLRCRGFLFGYKRLFPILLRGGCRAIEVFSVSRYLWGYGGFYILKARLKWIQTGRTYRFYTISIHYFSFGRHSISRCLPPLCRVFYAYCRNSLIWFCGTLQTANGLFPTVQWRLVTNGDAVKVPAKYHFQLKASVTAR